MKDILPIIVSCLALAVSIITAWLTLFRRGNLHMSRPVLIGFLYDLPQEEPKIFFRALLYATGKRGHIIESMYICVRRGESAQNFNFWMYGETQKLMIGSGSEWEKKAFLSIITSCRLRTAANFSSSRATTASRFMPASSIAARPYCCPRSSFPCRKTMPFI